MSIKTDIDYENTEWYKNIEKKRGSIFCLLNSLGPAVMAFGVERVYTVFADKIMFSIYFFANITLIHIFVADISTWPIMSTIATPIVTLIIYFIFVLRIGPMLMAKREPMKLKNTLLIYNIIQVLLSLWFLYLGLKVSLPYSESNCLTAKDRKENMEKAAVALWWYTTGKFSELLDTVFFVLRKSNHQVTWLHLYHHSEMVMSTWGILKYIMSEQIMIGVILNSFIHVIMYSYYLIAALGPEYRKYIWWKKHMTSMQLIQFVLIILWSYYLMRSDCVYSKPLTYFQSINCFTILVLFINFFFQSYIKKPTEIPLNNEKIMNNLNANNTEIRPDEGLRRRQ